LRGKDSNLRPAGYEPAELPTAPPRVRFDIPCDQQECPNTLLVNCRAGLRPVRNASAISQEQRLGLVVVSLPGEAFGITGQRTGSLLLTCLAANLAGLKHICVNVYKLRSTFEKASLVFDDGIVTCAITLKVVSPFSPADNLTKWLRSIYWVTQQTSKQA
jgi:hypothetical protein